ncbi:hypothetical protein BDQ12DRAFT_685500 [Crucibulum laeve]|uniref:Uncharacterized protein n=1 Tax=Crucibulum laeve TaxID=68775 RepID=A0A5C3M7Q9_9AGAR|nr:hypothetical protein BDQ12DRAFT_685500 [Crucibulum laeve]
MRNIKKELIEPSSPFGGMRRADFSHSISPLSPNVSEDEAAGGVGKDATEEEDEDIASSNDESRRRQEGKKGKKKAKELDRQGYSYPRHARRGRVRTARRGLNFVRGSTGSGRRGWGRWGRSDSSEQESSEDESSGSGSDISSASRRKTTPSTSTSSASPSARGATGVKAPSEANMAKEREKKEKQETEKEEREKEEKEKEAMGKEEKEKEEREEEEREKEEREKEEREKEEKEKEKREKKEQENERQESGNAERAAIVNGSGVEAMVVDVPARPPPAAQTPTSPIPASSATLTRAPTPTSAEVPIVAPTLTASVPTPASLAASTPTPAGEEGHSLKRRRESSTSVDRPAKRPERDSFPPISPPPTMPHRDPEGAAVMAALTAVADAINARNANGASGVPMVTNSSPIVASALAVMHGAVLSSSTQKTDTPGVPPTARALAEAVISIVKGPNGSTFLANVTPAAATPASKALSPILGAKAASPVLMDGIPAASAANGSLTNGSAKGATDTVAKTTPQSLTPILTNASTPALAIPNTALPKSIQGGTPAIQRINSNDRPNSSVNGQGSMSPSEFGSFPPRAKGKASFFGLAGEKSASEVKADVADIGAGVSSGVTGESGGMTGVEGGASGSQREGDMEEVHGVGVGEEFEHQPTHESRIRSQSPIHSPNSRARDDNSPFEEIGRLLSSSDDDQETCDLLVNGGVDVDMNDATGSGEEKKVVEQPVVLQHEASIVPPEEMLPPPAQLSVQKQTQHYHPPQNQHSAQPQVQQSQQPLSDLLLGGSVKGRDDMLQKVVSVVPGMLASLQALLEAATDGGISRGVSTGIGVCAGGSGEGGNMKGKEKEVQSVGRVDRGVMVNSAFPGPSSFDPQRSSLNDVARLARNGQIDPLLVSMLLERIDSLELEMLNEREERRSMQADIGDLQANEEDLRQQNILLHQQNANLRQHTTELRQQNAGLRQEVSSLKHDIGDLRRQMMSAPTMTPTSSVAVAGGHATNHNHNHDHVPTRPSSSASNAVRASGIPLSSLLDVEQLRASNNNTTAAPLVHLLALDLESIRSHAGPVAKDLPSPAPKDDAPATPAPSEGNPYVRRSMSQSDLIEEGLPLPIKSQRKHHMMTFPRSPMSMEE